MDDVVFIDLARIIIDYVDERFGRAAAWIAAMAILAVFVALIVGLIWWIAR